MIAPAFVHRLGRARSDSSFNLGLSFVQHAILYFYVLHRTEGFGCLRLQ
jgi:hypothetical protein